MGKPRFTIIHTFFVIVFIFCFLSIIIPLDELYHVQLSL